MPTKQAAQRPKISKRDLLARIMYASGVFGPYSSHPESLTILGLHRIADDQARSEILEEDCLSLSQSEFRRQIEWLQAHATIIDERTLIAHCKYGEPLPKRAVMITFDDGYRDNFTHAFPVLNELGASATFFIPTDLIDQRQVGWWDHIAFAVKSTKMEKIAIDDLYLATDDFTSKKHTTKILQQKMKLESADSTGDLVERVYAACQVAPVGRAQQDSALMSWGEIEFLANHGMTIGSHTCSHRVLSTLNPSDQWLELSRSKEVLESRLSRPIYSVAYPVGAIDHFNALSQEMAQKAGYEIAYSFETGQNFGPIENRFAIKRIPESPSRAMMAGAISMPGLFGGIYG